ncbi:hypothetical protein D3C84_998030 [compost metagenome]
MHLCTGRACLGPGGHIVGPEIRIGKLFCQVFGNRQGIGDHAELGLEQRNLGRGRILEQLLAGVGLVEPDQLFGVFRAGQRQGQRAAQGPGRNALVADDQVQAHVDSFLVVLRCLF